MSQSRAQQLDAFIQELTGHEVQAFQGLVGFKGQGEIIPLLSDVRTRPQPVGYMGASHSSGRTERGPIILLCFPKNYILGFYLILLQYVSNPALNCWRELISFVSSNILLVIWSTSSLISKRKKKLIYDSV